MDIRNRKRISLWQVFALSLTLLAPGFLAVATEYTSSGYKILDPVLAPAAFSSGGNYQLWSTIAEPGLGASAASSYQLGAGFLRYPIASSPAVSATPGDREVTLNWTASQGYLGWTPSGYNVGTAIAAGLRAVRK